MTTERDDYGLQPFKRGAAATPGANHASGEALSRAAMAASFEERQLRHETDCAAFNIARGPFELPIGSVQWTLRTDDRTRAETLTLCPLPARAVRDLIKAGIIDTRGVIIEAWKAEVEKLRL